MPSSTARRDNTALRGLSTGLKMCGLSSTGAGNLLFDFLLQVRCEGLEHHLPTTTIEHKPREQHRNIGRDTDSKSYCFHATADGDVQVDNSSTFQQRRGQTTIAVSNNRTTTTPATTVNADCSRRLWQPQLLGPCCTDSNNTCNTKESHNTTPLKDRAIGSFQASRLPTSRALDHWNIMCCPWWMSGHAPSANAQGVSHLRQY